MGCFVDIAQLPYLFPINAYADKLSPKALLDEAVIFISNKYTCRRKRCFLNSRIQIERLFLSSWGGALGCETYSKTIDMAVPVLSVGFRPKRVGFGLQDAPGRLMTVLCTVFAVTTL